MPSQLNIDPQRIDETLTRGVDTVLPKKATLAELMKQRPITLYLGIDPTGNFLHLGHSIPLRKLQQFAELGHKVILLVGNGTVKIGDPTGRDASRPELTDEEIEANFKDWQKQASKILDFELIEIRHNGDWLNKLNYSEIVKLMAKSTVQQLLERDMFQKRLEKNLPIHGHEIIYPLLQGYDSVAMNVDLEIGGTDQTFNMMMGRSLQQAYNKHEKWVLTVPLIEGTDGRKMSKSFNNYISLTEEPIDMYGKLMRVNDDLIVKYLTLLTKVPLQRIAEIETALKNGENPMTFKKELAFTITSELNGVEAAQKAATHFSQTVQGDEIPSDEQFETLEINVKTIADKKSLQVDGFSNSELARLIEQGAIKTVPEMTKITSLAEFTQLETAQKIKIGKRRWYQIKKI